MHSNTSAIEQLASNNSLTYIRLGCGLGSWCTGVLLYCYILDVTAGSTRLYFLRQVAAGTTKLHNSETHKAGYNLFSCASLSNGFIFSDDNTTTDSCITAAWCLTNYPIGYFMLADRRLLTETEQQLQCLCL